jgi:V/A-type H+-transporting ATPase subunit D
LQIIDKQYLLISKELKKATQKVNLFEKLLIPETKNAIKRINIVLGDEQVAAVGRAKTAKKKTIGASSIGEY